jgi:hypothetical protein
MLQRFLFIFVFLCLVSPAFAGFDEGKAAYDKKDWTGAITNLRPLAESGDDRAMILIGNMYMNGYGVIPSHDEARSLYRRSAAKNNTQAMNALGAIYISAIGVDQDVHIALQWFLRSAELGDQTGAFFYATLMLTGNKTPPNQIDPDPALAYKWFKVAAGEPQNSTYQRLAGNAARTIVTRKMLTADQAAKIDNDVAAWKTADPKTLEPLPDDTPKLQPKTDDKKPDDKTPATAATPAQTPKPAGPAMTPIPAAPVPAPALVIAPAAAPASVTPPSPSSPLKSSAPPPATPDTSSAPAAPTQK